MKGRSKEEINLLIKTLREKLANVLQDRTVFDSNQYLYYWLKYNQMNTDRTEKAIRKSIDWRKSVNFEELVEREWAFFAPGVEKEAFLNFDGFSKTGLPVSTVRSDGIDARKILRKYGKATLLRLFIQGLAKLEHSTVSNFGKSFRINLKKDNRPLDSSSLNSNGVNSGKNLSLQDDEDDDTDGGYSPEWELSSAIHISSLKDLTLRNFACIEGIQVLLEGATIGMTYFPAATGTVYLVNLNKVASMFIKMLKPILATGMFTLEIYDTDKSKWSKVLLEHIDADQLQTYFGGTQTFRLMINTATSCFF